jgi:sugar phosphate isomerase/epimerase
MHRRDFVRTLAAAPLAACASAHATSAASAASASSATRLNLGIQLYTLRDAARANLERTLADIAAVGFTEVELLASMSNFSTPARQLRAMLDRVGLRAPSTHIDGRLLANVDRLLDDAHVLGHEYIVLADLGDRRRSLDDFRSWADALNAAGAITRKAGIWTAWHDEPSDFVRFGDEWGYDTLVARTDPSIVRLQLDTGNAAMGGRDPMDLMRRYGERYWSFHIKDAPSLGAKTDAELGTGVVDIKGIVAAITDREHKHLFVEQETYPGAVLDSVRRDYAYMAALGTR